MTQSGLGEPGGEGGVSGFWPLLTFGAAA